MILRNSTRNRGRIATTTAVCCFRLTAAFLTITSVILVAAAGCRTTCNEDWSISADSPGGQFSARAHQDFCESAVGPAGTREDTFVDITTKHRSKNVATVLIPWGTWTRSSDMTVRWLNDTTLEVSVPNHTLFDRQISSYNGISIHARYIDDNPPDRAEWIKRIKARMGGSYVPEPDERKRH